MTAPLAAEYDALRDAADKAETALRVAVLSACPGPHNPTRNRDRKPPWCRSCGRTERGVLVGETVDWPCDNYREPYTCRTLEIDAICDQCRTRLRPAQREAGEGS